MLTVIVLDYLISHFLLLVLMIKVFYFVSGLDSTPTEISWLISNLPASSKVGIDPKLVTFVAWLDWEKELTNNGHILVPIKDNLVDLIWENKPAFIPKPVVSHSIEFAGMYYFFFFFSLLNILLFLLLIF